MHLEVSYSCRLLGQDCFINFISRRDANRKGTESSLEKRQRIQKNPSLGS